MLQDYIVTDAEESKKIIFDFTDDLLAGEAVDINTDITMSEIIEDTGDAVSIDDTILDGDPVLVGNSVEQLIIDVLDDNVYLVSCLVNTDADTPRQLKRTFRVIGRQD